MSENVIYSINGPVVKVKNAKDFSMLEMVYVGHAKLMGEVISISKDLTTIQVYETTTGLKPGEPVIYEFKRNRIYRYPCRRRKTGSRRAKTFYHPIRTDPAGQQFGA